ncbi:MAG: hypothetical protein C0623_14145 [Desulfuromonas sp.]|nr:MAG: hypothetical protein C0623_14145 [Desulfuromonas sp.]
MIAISKTPTISTELAFTRSFFRRNWLILGVALLMALVFGSQPMTKGILAGGLISIASFYWLNRSLKKLLGPTATGSKFLMQILSMLKLVIIALILLLLIMNYDIDPIGILIGLSIIVANVFVVVIKSLFTGDLS